MSSSQHIAQLVEAAIAKNTAMIFSKTTCPYCRRAKDLLSSRNIPFEALELDTRPDGSEIQSYLLERTKQSTVPNIFIKKRHIGGSSELTKFDASGQLKALMESS